MQSELVEQHFGRHAEQIIEAARQRCVVLMPGLTFRLTPSFVVSGPCHNDWRRCFPKLRPYLNLDKITLV